jgi:hypothetical protein
MTVTKTRLGMESLERREVPSITSVNLWGSNLYVYTDNAPTNVRVYSSGSGIQVYDAGNSASWTYSGVSWVGVYGGAGNDDFRNYVSSLPVTFVGYSGDDYLEGYNGADYLHGGDGNDTILGYGGNDYITGGNGQDRLKGMDGNDTCYGDAGHDTVAGGNGNDYLHGGDGNDAVIGGNGTDTQYGGNGDDSMVSIDGGTTDYADGQTGNDSVWTDQNLVWNWWGPMFYWDTGYAERSHSVTGFANGADRTLDGDWIADPTDGTFYKSFRDKPLFSVNGPTVDDVDQESVGDCWLMAPLGSLALDNPTAVRHMVADFGDGTYGVKLGNNFYRVDGDLPTWNATSTDQQYAGLGVGGSLWVALVEKAYAIHRIGANTYASLNNGDPADALRAYNLTNVGQSYFAAGSNSASVANSVFDHWNAYQSCNICTGTVATGSPLVANHCYSVVSVLRNPAGTVTNILVRNPWGGDNTSGNPYLWLTPAQLAACQIWVTWGNS